jgi:hypothetical protein
MVFCGPSVDELRLRHDRSQLRREASAIMRSGSRHDPGTHVRHKFEIGSRALNQKRNGSAALAPTVAASHFFLTASRHRIAGRGWYATIEFSRMNSAATEKRVR